MSVVEKIDEMKNRVISGERRKVKNRIELYSEGVKAKIKHASYSLQKIKELSSINDSMTTSEIPAFSVIDKIHFYVDSFFAFLYSIFDIISHIVNQKYQLGLDEKDVGFNRVKQKLKDSHAGTSIQKIFEKLSKKTYFKNLDGYRNCSTHRRQIYIKTITETGTPGYSASGNISIIVRVLCDNPLSVNPKTNQARILQDYCEGVFEKVEEEIINMSTLI